MNLEQFFHDAWSLHQRGELTEAERLYRELLQVEPQNFQATHNLGALCLSSGRTEEGLHYLRQAVRWQPSSALGHYNLAIALLSHGYYEEGWPEFQWRFQFHRPIDVGSPAWDGSSLNGRSILLHTEAGLGDTIQFVRYAAVLKAQGARVFVESQPSLVKLLQTCPGIDGVFARGSAIPVCDTSSPLLSMPAAVGTTLNTVPCNVPYLAANPDLVAFWQSRFSTLSGFKVGIAWQGDANYPQDASRSFRVEEFAPLAAMGLSLVSLQRGYGAEQLADCRFPVISLGPDIDTLHGPFMDTAAIMHSLDLVVTCDTAIGHLAGALGIPVWIVLSANPDWRWLADRDDYPWYPTMRLFRQRRPGDWREVFDRMAAELRNR